MTCDVCGAVLGDPMVHLQWHVSPTAVTPPAPTQDPVAVGAEQR